MINPILAFALGIALSVITFWLGWAVGRTHRTHVEKPRNGYWYYTEAQTSGAMNPYFVASFEKMDEAFREMDKAFEEARK